MTDDGWIKVCRSIMCKKWYFAEEFTRAQAWIDLLLLANYEPSHIVRRGIRIDVGRGQIAISQTDLAQRWKWTRKKVICFLDMLESEGMVVQQKTKLITLLSIRNYDKYQSVGTTKKSKRVQQKGQARVQQNGQQNLAVTDCDTDNCGINNTNLGTTKGTSKGTTKGTTLYNKEIKEERNNNYIYIGGDNSISIDDWENEMHDNPDCETICMALRISIEQLKGLLAEYSNDQRGSGNSVNSRREYRAHFFNWAKKKLNTKNHERSNNNQVDTRGGVRSGRRGYEVTATCAEDYKTSF